MAVGPVQREDIHHSNHDHSYTLELEISACKDLCKVDRYGENDPYCIVRWNERICGKTHVIKNTRHPE